MTHSNDQETYYWYEIEFQEPCSQVSEQAEYNSHLQTQIFCFSITYIQARSYEYVSCRGTYGENALRVSSTYNVYVIFQIWRTVYPYPSQQLI
jgi:hypothetical protein